MARELTNWKKKIIMKIKWSSIFKEIQQLKWQATGTAPISCSAYKV